MKKERCELLQPSGETQTVLKTYDQPYESLGAWPSPEIWLHYKWKTWDLIQEII